MSAEVIEMTPHVLQNAGVVTEGDQCGHSTVVAPSPSIFDGLTKPERELAVTGLIQTASGMLKQAIDSGEPADVMAGYKDQAAAIADLTKRLDVSKDAVLDAQVLQRRAERGLGLAIRAGQADGSIRGIGGDVKSEAIKTPERNSDPVKSPTEFLGNSGDATVQIYAMTDDVTENQFDSAITEAREERNVSRANVVRKLKAAAAEQADAIETSLNRSQAEEWHEALAEKYPTARLAYEAEGHERHESLDAFQHAARSRYKVKYRYTEQSYAKHVTVSRERLDRASQSIEVAISVFEHIDLDTITPELAEEALQRIDRNRLNLYIRSLKEIIENGK